VYICNFLQYFSKLYYADSHKQQQVLLAMKLLALHISLFAGYKSNYL